MDETYIRSMQEEILRLRGELSAACRALALTIRMVSLNDPVTLDVVVNKLTAISGATGPADVISNDYWREGIERFNDRLTGTLRNNPDDGTL